MKSASVKYGSRFAGDRNLPKLVSPTWLRNLVSVHKVVHFELCNQVGVSEALQMDGELYAGRFPL
jgi:hypothetical protein